MKKVHLTFIFLLTVLTLFSQRNFHESLEKRYKNAEVVFEGKVIDKVGFWDLKKTEIFTKNTILVDKTFKGKDRGIIEIITQGGEVGNDFQFISHGIEFKLGEEGLFFCKKFDIANLGDKLMINGQNGFIPYQRHEIGLKAFDNGVIYENLRTEVYSKFPNFQPVKPFFGNASSSFDEKNLEFIEFGWDNLEVTGIDYIEFDLFARASTNGILFGGGDIRIKYGTPLFGINVVSQNNIEISKKDIIEGADYSLSITDEDFETLKIVIGADCKKPSGLYPMSTSFEKLSHIKIKIADVYQIGALKFDDFQLDGSINYFNPRLGCIPFDKIIAPTPIQQLTIPLIDSHDLVLTAGTGFSLNIIGKQFGIAKGKVLFKNADKDNATMMLAENEDVKWSDTLIQVRVPSRGDGGFSGGQPPAGSGFFKIKTASPVMEVQSPSTVEIKYAVNNFRNSSDQALWTYFGENTLGDGTKDGILTFRYGSVFQSNSLAKTLLDTAICQWTNATSVQWELGTLSPTNSTADNDKINLIYFAPNSHFFGEHSNTTAFTKITGTRIEPCLPDIRFIREVDIVIRQDLTALSPPVSGGYHFSRVTAPMSNQIDFYSVILHELGHAHLLRHALPDTKVMYPFTPQGIHRRIISPSDKMGGLAVLDTSNLYLNMVPACDVSPIQSGGMCFPTAVNERSKNLGIKIYPNPFERQINIKIPPLKEISVELFNTLGENVFRKKYQNHLTEIQIDTDKKLPSGIYYMLFRSENNLYSFKLLKL